MSDYLEIDGQKMRYHSDRLNQWLSAKTKEEKLNVFPIYVEVSPMGSCNHRCTFCAVDYIGYKAIKLETQRLKTTLLDMGLNGVKSVMFAGEGEPTLHPELSDIVNFCKEGAGIDVAITTNGTGLKPLFIEECIKNISWIKVSCNAGTSETYAEIHRTKEGDWKRVWDNLSFATVHRDLNNYKTKIGVQMVLLPENIDEVQSLVYEAAAHGLDYVVIKPYSQHNSSITREYEGIMYKDYNKIMETIVANNRGINVIWRSKAAAEHDSPGRRYEKCYSTPFMWAYIMSSGEVYGCSAYLEDGRFRYGNINQDSFSNIWRGEGRSKAIDFVSNELSITECRKNCRMEQVNRHLWDVKHPHEHSNFI